MPMFARVSAVLVVLGLLFGHVPVAAASVDWCEDDPVISVNGTLVNIVIGVPRSNLETIAGPVRTVVTVPTGVRASVVYVSTKYFQEEVSIVYAGSTWTGGSIPIMVAVTVPGATSFQTKTTTTVPATGQSYLTYGTSNVTMVQRFAIANTRP